MIASLRFTPSLEQYGEGLREKPALLDAAIEERVTILAARLLARIQVKLSGEVLETHRGDGGLLGSVQMQAATWAGSVCGAMVGIPDGSPFFIIGATHEFGGTRWYDIWPGIVTGKSDKRALAFFGGNDSMPGESIMSHALGGLGLVVRHVDHPPAIKRPFIATSVEEIRPQFYEQLGAVLDSFLGGGGEAA